MLRHQARLSRLAGFRRRETTQQTLMIQQRQIRVLFVEPDPKACRSVKLYLQGLAGNQLDIKSASSAEELQELSEQTWDVLMIDVSRSLNGRGELINLARRMLGRIPEVNVGTGAGSLMTTCAETTVDDFFAKIAVNPAAVLRSVSNLLERRRLEQGLEEKDIKLAAASHLDEQTGLWSEIYMIDRLMQEFRNCRRYQIDMTVCLLEIAEFNAISSNYGPDASSRVLAAVADVLRSGSRTTDFTGRWGQAGFAVCWTNTPVTGALIALDRIRKSVESKVFSSGASNFSVGARYAVAQLSPEHESFEEFFGLLRQVMQAAGEQPVGHIEVADPLNI